VKRTFLVAVFGASDAANERVLRSLQRARSGELVAVLDGVLADNNAEPRTKKNR